MSPAAGDAARPFVAAGDAQAPFFVGVDVGGTNIKVGVVDDRGRGLSCQSIPTDVARGPDDAVRRMAAAIAQVIGDAQLPKDRIAAVGLGVPGGVDAQTGLLRMPVNLPGWSSYPLRDRLSTACSLPVTYANDGAAAGYGEFWVGSARSLQSMVLLTLGTGVGGAIFLGETSIDGAHGSGAELGHTIIDYNKNARLCACGQRGHLEAYASATAVIRRTAEALAAGADSTLKVRTAAGEALTPLMIAEEAQRQDAVALDIVLETARYVGIAVVNAMHTIDPDGVVIGGAMTFGGLETALGRQFLAQIKAEVKQRALPGLAERTAIELASLGGDAGWIGAAGLARLARSRGV